VVPVPSQAAMFNISINRWRLRTHGAPPPHVATGGRSPVRFRGLSGSRGGVVWAAGSLAGDGAGDAPVCVLGREETRHDLRRGKSSVGWARPLERVLGMVRATWNTTGRTRKDDRPTHIRRPMGVRDFEPNFFVKSRCKHGKVRKCRIKTNNENSRAHSVQRRILTHKKCPRLLGLYYQAWK